MTQLTKSTLKLIVKECLVEILQEGLLTTNEVINESKGRQPKRRAVSEKKSMRRVGLDNIKFSKSEQSKSEQNEDLKKNIQETTRSMTSDPVLSSILADTAMTTLQDQFRADDKGGCVTGGDAASLQAARSSPDELFSESASKWADLAFAPSIRAGIKNRQ